MDTPRVILNQAHKMGKMRAVSALPRLIRLSTRDNVAVAVKPLHAGDPVEEGGVRVTPSQPIPAGHKVAIQPIQSGAEIVKYGEVIGIATADIAAGAHVHVHNVRSARLPG